MECFGVLDPPLTRIASRLQARRVGRKMVAPAKANAPCVATPTDATTANAQYMRRCREVGGATDLVKVPNTRLGIVDLRI